jgi:hypothetical protein
MLRTVKKLKNYPKGSQIKGLKQIFTDYMAEAKSYNDGNTMSMSG